MIVNVIIPTHDRINILKKTIDSLLNSDYPELKIWICVDGNRNMIRAIKDHCPNHDVKILHNKRRMDAIFSYNKILSAIDNEGAILNATDDLVFYPGTISTAVAKLERTFRDTDGVIGLNQYQDGNPKGRKYAFCLIGRKFAERYPGRQIYCPDYIHFNSDRELGFHAQNVRKFCFLPAAKIVHIRLPDNTTKLGRTVYVRDKRMYRERQARKILWGLSFKLIANELKI